MRRIKNLSVIFANLDFLSKPAEDVADPNYRYCHSKVIFKNLGASPKINLAEGYCHVGISNKNFSMILCTLISHMLLLSHKRNVLLLKNWKKNIPIFKKHVLNTEIIQKMISRSHQDTSFQDFFFEIKCK